MIFTTYQSAPLALLLAFPNWDKEITVELQLPCSIDKGVSALESRRVFSSSARYAMAFTAYFGTSDESQRFRLFLARLKNELLACPMWTDQCFLAGDCIAGATVLQKESDNPARYGAEWILINDDASVWEIVTVDSLVGNNLNLHAGTANAWTAGSAIYPLIFGRLAERPKPEWITDETAMAEIKVEENSDFAHRLNPFPMSIPTVGATMGGTPNFSALPIWNIYPRFEKPADSTESDVVYKSLGFQRADQSYIYSQAENRRTLDLPFFRSGRDEIANVEAFFVDRRGSWRSFMMPTFRGDMRLTADLPNADPRLIPIEESGKPGAFEDGGRPANPGDPFVALVTFDLTDLSIAPAVEPVKLSSIDGSGLHTVNVVAQTHHVEDTLVCHMLLARFTEAKLSWTYKTDGLATTSIKFTELSNEYESAPTDLPQPVFLYRFTHQLATPQIYRFTSYENQIVIATGDFAGTFLPGPFDHDGLKTSVKIDDEKIDIASFLKSGNPLSWFLPFQLEAPLWLEIVEVDFADLTATPETIFTGEIWDVEATGPEIKATGLIYGRHMDRYFPDFNIQKVCNYSVYSPAPKCGVSKAAMVQSGNITTISGNTVRFAGGAAKPDDYFSIGFVETGAGANFERRQIMKSTQLGGGAGTELTLKFPLAHAVVGQSLSAYPGCDGTKETCDGVFNNLGRMGAFPFVPDINPTIKAMQAKSPGGKKNA